MKELQRFEPFTCDTRAALGVGAVIHDTYRVLGLLGSGGMGDVYEAEHLRLGSRVALKVLRVSANEPATNQLLREARLTARFASDYIVHVYDCNLLADGSPYVVMERLLGEDLRHLLEREPQLTVQRALRIALQVCAGLTALHAAGVVHRDLKPANVFVLRTVGDNPRCKLLDLGIARSLSGDTSRSSILAGSVRYMAPEALADRTRVNERTDVYAAAAILYQSLTGVLPHPGETMEEVMFSILNRRVHAVSELRPEVSKELSALVSRALGRDVERRPESAAAFGQALSQFLGGMANERKHSVTSEATLQEVTQPAKARNGRSRLRELIAVGVFGVSVLGGAVALRSAFRPSAKSTTPILHAALPASVPTPLAASVPTATAAPIQTEPGLGTPKKRVIPAEHPRHSLLARAVGTARSAPVLDSSADLALEKNPYAQ